MDILGSIIDLWIEVEKIFSPRTAIKRLQKKLDKNSNSTGNIQSYRSSLLELYLKTGQPSKARDCYDKIKAASPFVRWRVPGQEAYLLARMARYELHTLKDEYNALISARRAYDLARKHNLLSVIEVLRLDFPLVT